MMGRSIAHGQQQEGPKACYSRGHHTHALPVLSTLAHPSICGNRSQRVCIHPSMWRKLNTRGAPWSQRHSRRGRRTDKGL